MARHRQWHFSGWPVILLSPLLLSAALAIGLVQTLFRMKTTADLTPHDVESYLDDMLHDRGGDWDWDDFTSIQITDPALDEVRRRADMIPLPLTRGGRMELQTLLEEVRRVEQTRSAPIPQSASG